MAIRVLIEFSAPFGLSLAAAPPAPPAAIAGIKGFDAGFTPVPMSEAGGLGLAAAPAGTTQTYVARAEIDQLSDIDDIAGLPDVRAIWSDAEVAAFPDIDMNPPAGGQPLVSSAIDCDSSTPTGAASDVAERLGIPRVWQNGFSGQNIAVGIVDGGVDGGLFPVDDGWSPPGAPSPGDPAVGWGGHGNMCAFDSLIAAPHARIFDYGIGRAAAGIPATLANALQCFQHAIDSYRTRGIPQVLSNSWGLYQDSWDPFPKGHPGNYTHNPNHPFTRKVVEAMNLGILVTFAAGNCGDGCTPGARCGGDVGPGRSIRGANGHPRVICVGAVNLRRERVGYSSQGPATLDAFKPDLCGYTHFTGQTTCDNGTSAACPVVAGVLATLRSAFPALRQDRARGVLAETAVNINQVGWDPETGHGVLNAAAAYERLRSGPGMVG